MKEILTFVVLLILGALRYFEYRTEDGYEIRLGQKNPSCYPCCFEGSVCACRSDLCIKHRDNYIREHGKLPQGESIYLRRVKP